jgi:hypothetical protein
MCLVFRAFPNPLNQASDLCGAQCLMAFLRRHPILRIRGRNACDQGTAGGLTRNDGGATLTQRESTAALIKPEASLAMALVGTMTLIAAIRQNRSDVPVELKALGNPLRIRQTDDNPRC